MSAKPKKKKKKKKKRARRDPVLVTSCTPQEAAAAVRGSRLVAEDVTDVAPRAFVAVQDAAAARFEALNTEAEKVRGRALPKDPVKHVGRGERGRVVDVVWSLSSVPIGGRVFGSGLVGVFDSVGAAVEAAEDRHDWYRSMYLSDPEDVQETLPALSWVRVQKYLVDAERAVRQGLSSRGPLGDPVLMAAHSESDAFEIVPMFVRGRGVLDGCERVSAPAS